LELINYITEYRNINIPVKYCSELKYYKDNDKHNVVLSNFFPYYINDKINNKLGFELCGREEKNNLEIFLNKIDIILNNKKYKCTDIFNINYDDIHNFISQNYI
jgi:hypothetical protein